MLISSISNQLPLFAPQLSEPAPRINNTTPTAPSSTMNRTIPFGPRAESLEARVRRSLDVMQARPRLRQAA